MSELVVTKDLSELKKKLEHIKSDQILLVVDSNVYNLYRKEFDFLNFKGKKVILWKCLEGEGTKSFEELERAVEFFLSKEVHRNAHLVAVGGGATTDFGGFVASMLLRGVKWSAVPTSLLGMIDAAVGGKVAINSESGKNLIGAFHMPNKVYFYHDFLKTLSLEETMSGKGELLKYCFLDKEIHDLVMERAPLADIINTCAKYKQKIVDGDFKESGGRKVLNLGHTFGHAVERIYGLSHGVAVVWGMILMFKVFEDKKSLVTLKSLIDSMELPYNESPWYNKSFPIEDVMTYVRKDKKTQSGESLEVILSEGVGIPHVESITFKELESKLKEKEDEIRKFVL